MRISVAVSLLAAVLLVSACETTPDKNAGATGDGLSSAGRAAPGSQGDLQQTAGDRVFFDYDRYTLTPEARATLDKQVAWLKKYPQVTATIEGHADERGTREYNLALGERRATSVRNYLTAQGVPTARLRTISYGKERPEALGSDEASWAQNRRGVTTVE